MRRTTKNTLVAVGIAAMFALVGCTSDHEGVEGSESALTAGGERALAALTRLANGDEAMLAEFSSPAVAIPSRHHNAWSIHVRLDDEGKIEGYSAISADQQFAFVLDFTGATPDGVVSEIAGVALRGASTEELARAEGDFLADFSAVASAPPDGSPPVESVRTQGLGTVVSDLLVKCIAPLRKVAVREAEVSVSKAATGATNGATAGAPRLTAGQGAHRAVSVSVNTGVPERPGFFEAARLVTNRLRGKAILVGDEATSLLRAKPPERTVALEMPTGIGIGQNARTNAAVAAKLEAYLAKIAPPGEFNLLQVASGLDDGFNHPAARLVAERSGASHVLLTTEETMAQASLELAGRLDRYARVWVAGVRDAASSTIAVLGRRATAGGLLASPTGETALGPAVERAGIVVFTRAAPASVVTLVKSGRRVVLVDADGTSRAALAADPAFRALPEETRALVQAL